ncbi:hypothetical protein DFR55_101383 [Herbinix hemicellulosilytica]|uniref:Putative membrane protein n=1 Tax=Herbinix hemicellulosilytica TaxID=1564487 RepID=A0A0H5SGJ3_HERHM|nr:hypothetical protein [Herbinix hemicellulosilytica]RBP60922.1 hypothetical protein DFR55_101383 [Herbinix hemicellulosilytica]CRZ34617.1 putative membrane protein [Herbinix hemicellulosilytica]
MGDYMFKNLIEFNNAVNDLLHDIVCGKDIDSLLLEDDFRDDTLDVIAYCIENKYLTNIEVWCDGDGKLHMDTTGNVRITRDGLAFMEAHSEKAIKKLKRDVFTAKLQSWISLLVAIASLIVSIFKE